MRITLIVIILIAMSAVAAPAPGGSEFFQHTPAVAERQ